MGQGLSGYTSPFMNKALEFHGKASQSFASMEKKQEQTTQTSGGGGSSGVGGILGAATGIGLGLVSSGALTGLGGFMKNLFTSGSAAPAAAAAGGFNTAAPLSSGGVLNQAFWR